MELKTLGKIGLFLVTPVALIGGYVFVKKVILKQPLFPVFPKKDGKKEGDIITRTVAGETKKYQVTATGQVKDLSTGQLANLVGHKKAGAK